MKKMKGLLLAATLMISANALIAQSYTETALMFSRPKPSTGSARILGMGGAQVSLGGDFSSAFSNPAGLGMFNRSEFSITPSYSLTNNTGSYFTGGNLPSSENNLDTKSSLNISGLGLVFSRPQQDQGFIHGTFAITVNKLNDFNSNLSYSGVNDNSSLINYFLNEANFAGQTGSGGNPDQFDQGGDLFNTVTEVAYRNFLIGEASIIDPSFPSNAYFTDFDRDVNPNVEQTETIRTRGGQNQWNFSYGANFDDRFFLGGGIGVVALNFQSLKTYTEAFTDQPIDSYTLTEDLQIKGTGINATVGAIGRPVDGLQIGVAVTTPTRYNLNDVYSADIHSFWNNFDYYGDGSVVLNDENEHTDVITTAYNLNTPWRFAAGASYIFGKSGLISIDVERLNYGGAKYSSQTDGISYKSDNTEIQSQYASVTNFRAGGEYRLKSLRFRLGGGYMPDPYKELQNGVSTSRISGSAGVGYRKSKFFVDLAYVQSMTKGTYRPYTVPEAYSPILEYKRNTSNVVTTIGFIF